MTAQSLGYRDRFGVAQDPNPSLISSFVKMILDDRGAIVCGFTLNVQVVPMVSLDMELFVAARYLFQKELFG